MEISEKELRLECITSVFQPLEDCTHELKEWGTAL